MHDPKNFQSGQRGRIDRGRESGQPVLTLLEAIPYLPNMHRWCGRSSRSLHIMYYAKSWRQDAASEPIPPQEPTPTHPSSPAISGRVVEHARGRRRQPAFARLLGLSERTVRRMERAGATLTQALAIVGAEHAAGNVLAAAYVASMIGETQDLAPTWTRSIPWLPSPKLEAEGRL